MSTFAPNRRWLILLLTSVGLINLPHFQYIETSVMAFFNGLLVWRWLGIWQPRWLPSKLILFLITLIGGSLWWTHYHSFLGQDGGTSLFIISLGLKLLEIQRERDLYLISYLGFIVASTLFLYDQNIVMLLYISLVCIGLFSTLIVANSPFTLKLALRQSVILLAQALPLTFGLFILVPRVDAPHWMWLHQPPKNKTGLSDSLEPGSMTDLGLSRELVFRVKFKGERPPANQRYWRGPTYSYTDGKQWLVVPQTEPYQAPDLPQFTGQAYRYQLLMEPQEKNWLYALDLPAEWSSQVQQTESYQLQTQKSFTERAEYEIVSYPHYQTGSITMWELQQNLQLPLHISPKIQTLVQQLQTSSADPEKFAEAVFNYFHQQGFYYTLTPPAMNREPIETFLFQTKRGFCSHYATAFVYLMRVAKIPARVIGGYQGGELNPIGNFLEIRQADAHAWAEIWIAGKGWQRIDPTAAVAPERIEQGINIDQQVESETIAFSNLSAHSPNWLKQLRQTWDNIDYQWQRWVINYDRQNQTHFLTQFGIQDFIEMIRWLIIIGGIVIALLAFWLLKPLPHKIDPVQRIYQQFCRKLANVKMIKTDSEGAFDFCQRASLQFPSQAESIIQITQLYLQLRYGKITAISTLSEFKQKVKQFKIRQN